MTYSPEGLASAIFLSMGLDVRSIGRKIRSSLGRLRREKGAAAERAEAVQAPKLSDEAFSLLKQLSEELGARPAASAESRAAARRVASLFQTFSDNVSVTSGRIIPGLQRWMLLSSIVSASIVLVLALGGLPYLSIPASALFIASVIGELRRKGNFLRSFFPTGEASNVHAVIEPSEQVERTVIVSAHHDSAPVKNSCKGAFLSLFSETTAALGYMVLVGAALIQCIAEIIQKRLLQPGLPPLVPAVLSIAAFVTVLISFISCRKDGESFSPGAGDNLSGVSVVATLGRCFRGRAVKGEGLRHTRLVLVSFDGEECGAEGSALWYRENSHILINPVNINLDAIYREEDLVFLVSDGNGFVQLSSRLASRCSMISSEMGYSIPTGRIGFFGGETDAASASRCGIASTTLTAAPPGVSTPAHTEEATPDKVSPEALSRAISVTIKLIEGLDRPEEEGKSEENLLEGNRKLRISKF